MRTAKPVRSRASPGTSPYSSARELLDGLPKHPKTPWVFWHGEGEQYRAWHQTLARLCERVREMLGIRGFQLVTCEVGALTGPDPVAVDALARMQLTARRAGGSIRLRHARARLRDLLSVIGLCEALPRCGQTVRAGRQVEQREQIWVDEEVDPADPSA